MDVLTKFILIISGITVAAGLGYSLRKLNLVAERLAGPLMFYTVVLLWTPLSVFVLWQLQLQWSLVALPIISALLPLAMAPVGLGLGRLHDLDRRSGGAYVVACGIANIGATMGGFVCYAMFGMEGLGYAQLYVMTWTFTYVGFYYPFARHLGDPSSSLDVGFVLRTFFDRRALPALGSIIGLTLNWRGFSFPVLLNEYHIVDAFVIGSVLLSFFAMGLQIHFTSIGERPQLHVSLGAAKFIVAPLLTLVLLVVIEPLVGALPPVARSVTIVEGFMPTAIFAVIIANLFHLNSRLASALFLVNTVAFLVLVLPILIFVFG